jgi:MFS family permease
MAMTAISEFVPNQWVALVLEGSGAKPMLVMALTFGVMALGRYFGGDIVHKFDQTGVLLGSAIVTAIGIFMLSSTTGSMTYVSAIIFGLGICYFWPNMIGFVAEKIPKSGALGMSVVGAIGMFMTANMQPIFGIWIDNAKDKAAALGLSGDALELATGQETLKTMTIFPIILIVFFTILYFWVKKYKLTNAVPTEALHPTDF